MTRTAILLVTLAAAVLGCKRESSSGLPPAKEWTASSGSGAPEAVAPDPSAGTTGEPGANPHAGVPGAGGANPHSGVPGAPGGPAGGNDMMSPQPTAPKALDKLPDGRYVVGPFAFKLPEGWTVKPVTSSMRAGELTFGTDGDIIVYYFGEGGAGSIQDNLDRWIGQVTPAGGKAAKDVAKIEQIKVAGQDATLVTVAGRVAAPSMMAGTQAVDITDGELLGAIVASPKGPYYFKGIGSKATMDANAPKLRAMLASFEIH